jgi:nitrate/nitrite transport system ATP-binding protein
VMMTNGPSATIGEILEIDLPRPRDRIELSHDPAYNDLRHEVLRFLYEKQGKSDELPRAATAPTSPASRRTVTEGDASAPEKSRHVA